MIKTTRHSGERVLRVHGGLDVDRSGDQLESMSLARLTESIRRAGANISEARRVLLADLSKEFDAPPPSTIRRIVRDWPAEGLELGGHRVSTEKREGRLYLVIQPQFGVVREMPVRQTPLYHQFGRVVSL
jgi:hypothetical protein